MTKKQAVVSGVTIEWDDTKHQTVNVKDGPLDKATKLKSAKGDDEFTPNRIVIDLKLDLGDPKVMQVNLDDVHVKIPYDNAGQTPTVVWWNGARWVKFKQMTYTNKVADVTLPSPWPTDPAIGIGP